MRHWAEIRWIGLAVILLLSGQSSRAAMIDVGAHTLLPNTPGQQIPIFITGTELIQGLDLNVQIGDGGAIAGGTDTGPIFTNITITGAGEIFQNNNTGVRGTIFPLKAFRTTTTTGAPGQETVLANGKLATLIIDTTGFFGGTFPLILDPPGSPTDLADSNIPLTIVNGTISIVDPKFWRNSPDALDVNNSGFVDPTDALIVIDELNIHGPHALAVPPAAPNTPPPFFDVDGNNAVGTADALIIIDFLNTGVHPAPPMSASQSASLAVISSVPEPSSIALAAIGGLVLFACRRRKS